MTREELMNNVEAAKAAYKAEYEKAEQHARGTVQRWLKELNLEHVSVTNSRQTEYFELGVAKDGDNRYHTLDLHFDKLWSDDARKLKMNTCTFGTFTPGDMCARSYYVAVGKVAERLDEIERDLLSYDWKKFDELQASFYDARYELDKFDREQKKLEEESKKNELRRKICVGLKVNCGKRHRWSDAEEVKTIESVTAKNVIFAEDWGHRTKIDELLRNLSEGSWKLIA